MEPLRQTRGVICFTNPQQFPFILQQGIYGNVSVGDIPRNTTDPHSVAPAKITRFGKLKDLLNIVPGDYVFLFETGSSRLHGVWRVSDEPFYCTTQIFDPTNNYPYRLYLQYYINFPNPVPSTELHKLLNKNVLWSIRTFERERNMSFASINPLTIAETDAILEMFWRYNHRFDATADLVNYHHQPLTNTINFHDLVAQNQNTASIPLRITADDLGQIVSGDIYEYALHVYLIYNLVRCSPSMRNLFGQYREVLREVPVSVAGQRRPDLILIYHSPITEEPNVYSIVEVKRGRVDRGMLSQLLEYIRLFSERHGLDFNAVEGIYIGSGFEQNALDYARERAEVEAERPLRLIEYMVSGNTINLNTVT